MAKKVIFIPDINNILLEPIIDFVYVKGMAFSQKQKCMSSLHEAIAESYPNKRILEVSTKSYDSIGVKLSAFNLTLNNHYVESVFQSSKVFEGNIQYSELIKAMPRDAKKYVSEHSDKPLIKFRYDNQDYPLIPKSMFYDFIYIQALCEHKELAEQLLNYDIFTDIEFNEKMIEISTNYIQNISRIVDEIFQKNPACVGFPVVFVGGGSKLYGFEQLAKSLNKFNNSLFITPTALGARDARFTNCVGALCIYGESIKSRVGGIIEDDYTEYESTINRRIKLQRGDIDQED